MGREHGSHYVHRRVRSDTSISDERRARFGQWQGAFRCGMSETGCSEMSPGVPVMIRVVEGQVGMGFGKEEVMRVDEGREGALVGFIIVFCVDSEGDSLLFLNCTFDIEYHTIRRRGYCFCEFFIGFAYVVFF